MPRHIQIAERKIGTGQPAYIIAELSGNHGQDYHQAEQLVYAAKEAGVDAVKLQTYTPDTMTLRNDQPYFKVQGGTIWDGRYLHDLYQEAHTPWEWQPKLKELATKLGLHLFSTPFDATSVEFLEAMEVPAYKVASFELVDLPLIERIAATGKPTIISTGMATLAEIEDGVTAFRRAGGEQLALLKCVSSYPANADEMNLRTIPHLSSAFDLPVGLSDHALTSAISVTAVALGACIIEKHLTLSRAVPGPDSAFSLEPHEFKTLVEQVRAAEAALGDVHYGLSPKEAASRMFRRSLFVVRDVQPGEVLDASNVRCIRPGHGLMPKYLPEVLGRRAATRIAAGTPLSWDHLGSTTPETAPPLRRAV